MRKRAGGFPTVITGLSIAFRTYQVAKAFARQTINKSPRVGAIPEPLGSCRKSSATIVHPS
jgi:hypothetical protein